MTHAQAWEWITSHWMTPAWRGIPSNVREVLNLHNKVGVCNGSLVTQESAKGMREFINNINRNRE